jgi:Lrp/AsnC family transcriptional regulator for asnA, asnC and gidA
MNLDSLDRKILFALDTNARLSGSELAARFKQGSDRINYRIERFKQAGIVKSYTAIIDPFKLGLMMFKAYLLVEDRMATINKLIKLLETESKGLFWIGECEGRYDFLYSVCVKDTLEYYQLHTKILSTLQKLIVQLDVFPLVKLQIHRRGYFDKKHAAPIVLGGCYKKLEVDELDRKIINLFSQHARLEFTEVAAKVKANPQTVRLRYEKLLESGLIAGTRLSLGYRKLNLCYFKVMIALKSYDLDTLKKIELYAYSQPHIIFYIEQIGAYPIEFQIEATDHWHLNDILEDFRLQFPYVVAHLETMVIKREHYYGLV